MYYEWDQAELTLKDIESGISIPRKILDIFDECKPHYRADRIADIEQFVENYHEISFYPAKSNLFIGDSEHIESCPSLVHLMENYSDKIDQDKEVLIFTFEEKKFDYINLGNIRDQLQVYEQLLEDVILDIGSLNKDKIKVCPEIFFEIQKSMKSENLYLNYIVQILSLLVISDRVLVSQKQPEIINFIINRDGIPNFIKIDWNHIESVNTDFWYRCYKWIVSDNYSSVNKNIRRNIVREFVVKNQFLNSDRINKDMKYEFALENILRIIISDRTSEYFEMQKVVKKEYTDLFDKNVNLFNNIINVYISLIVALAIGIYGIMYNNGEIIRLDLKNRPLSVLLIIFLIAEIFIFTSTNLKISELENHKDILDEFNNNILMTKSTNNMNINFKNNKTYIFFIVSSILIFITTIAGIVYYY